MSIVYDDVNRLWCQSSTVYENKWHDSCFFSTDYGRETTTPYSSPKYRTINSHVCCTKNRAMPKLHLHSLKQVACYITYCSVFFFSCEATDVCALFALKVFDMQFRALPSQGIAFAETQRCRVTQYFFPTIACIGTRALHCDPCQDETGPRDTENTLTLSIAFYDWKFMAVSIACSLYSIADQTDWRAHGSWWNWTLSRPVLIAPVGTFPALFATVLARPDTFRPPKPPSAAPAAEGGFDGTKRTRTRSDGRQQGRNSADGCGEDRA